MKIVKKIANWILREELFIERLKHERKVSELESEKEVLRRLSFGNRQILLSQTILKFIVETLPDSNRVGAGDMNTIWKLKNFFVDELRGQKYQHTVLFETIGKDKNIQGITVHISEYDIDVFIPLCRENIYYEVCGVSSTIDTYFWDFYRAGIRMVSDEAWAMSIEFITAQNNVMKELREEGLL
jgi:hypothetical protein